MFPRVRSCRFPPLAIAEQYPGSTYKRDGVPKEDISWQRVNQATTFLSPRAAHILFISPKIALLWMTLGSCVSAVTEVHHVLANLTKQLFHAVGLVPTQPKFYNQPKLVEWDVLTHLSSWLLWGLTAHLRVCLSSCLKYSVMHPICNQKTAHTGTRVARIIPMNRGF